MNKRIVILFPTFYIYISYIHVKKVTFIIMLKSYIHKYTFKK